MAWADEAQAVAGAAEACAGELVRGPPTVGSASRPAPGGGSPTRADWEQAVRDAAGSADRLAGRLAAAGGGERAAVLLADLGAAAAADRRPANRPGDPKVQRQVVTRVREEIASAAKALRLNPSAAEFETRLAELVSQATAVARDQPAPDYAAAARTWADPARARDRGPAALVERLLAAAQAEAVRPGGDLRLARDYNLSARAAAAIETANTSPIQGRAISVTDVDAGDDAAAAYAATLDVLLDGHRPDPRSVLVPFDAVRAAAASAAERARERMRSWAGDTGRPTSATRPRPPRPVSRRHLPRVPPSDRRPRRRGGPAGPP
jgi:hypothetical protein